MSTDVSVWCHKCGRATHLGQRMAMTYSFGYGSKDTDTPLPDDYVWDDFS